MSSSKLKHLEFIQNVVGRMNSNSFLLKGWAITVVTALFALSASDANMNYVLIAYFAIPVFWMLDGFYVSVERSYRDLYRETSSKAEEEIDFSMEASKYRQNENSWLNSTFSKTLVPFYGTACLATLMVMFLIKNI